ncbi:aspartyl-phosphate phosphatase Spo0E family protein [Rossellomorea aquimaris]|uniref:aspartyl-phosphate phosphatase Spo0E family protein n=1 Tax=Rossellomorea TaxID=2837508 RepID=UPI001CD44BD4|nr:aspartyl-phosphate phosphatase Spo0E family protein [Rossellomorea aquimaris]MCA1059385.1 aspartyl-phosphate phosphatase Spo0E family protein [Rossellomorea aquimaris]
MNGTIAARIEVIRSKMIQSGIRFGLSNPTTIQLSEELDALINIHQRDDSNKRVQRKIIQ